MTDYEEFIRSKRTADPPTGIASASSIELNPKLFPFQKKIVHWALYRGRACIWADCGLGKTAIDRKSVV